MIQLLYFDRMTPDQRCGALMVAGLFGFFEGLALLSVWQKAWIAYSLGSLGMLCLGLALARAWSGSHRVAALPPYPDLLVYAAALAATVRPALWFLPGAMPDGLVLARIDSELFLLGVSAVVAAIVFPSLNDIHIQRTLPDDDRFGPVEYLKSIEFGWRRTATAALGILLLASVAIALLVGSEGPLASALAIFGFGLLLPWVFEHGYGYHSHIMRIFGITLFAVAALALMLRTPYSSLVPRVAVQTGVVVWSTVWVGFGFQIARETDSRQLVRAQKFWQCVYLGVLGLGHFAIYVWWIHPILAA